MNLTKTGVIAIEAAFSALRDPKKQDKVAALAETTGLFAFERIRDTMLKDKNGRRILRTRPIVHSTTIPIDKLKSLPETSFGHQYIRFLETHQVSPDTRTEVKYIKEEELAYVALRYRQIHDYWHTLLNLDVSVQGEIALKWFEMVQLGLPMNVLSSFVGPLRLNSVERQILFEKYVPWALRSASRADFLMNIKYEDHFEDDIEYLRKKWKIEPLLSRNI